MRLLTEMWGDSLVVTVDEDRIDAAAAVRFKDEMRTLLENSPDRVILDMSRVDSIDSSGLGAVVAVMKLLGPGRKLELAALSQKVETVLRLTRMDRVMTIHDALPAEFLQTSRAS